MGLLGHVSVSEAASEAEHMESGQVLVLARVPDPQVTEQEDHSPQASKMEQLCECTGISDF